MATREAPKHVGIVSIELQPPRNGWLPFALQLDEYRLEEAGSSILNDPLRELVEAGSFLARGEIGTRRVFIWVEPAGYAIDLDSLDGVLCRVSVGTRAELYPFGRSRTLRTEVERTVDSWSLARAIREAVDELFAAVGSERELPGWHDPSAYADTLAELRSLTRERRARR